MFPFIFLPCSFYHVPFILLPCSLCHVPFTMFLLYSYHVPFAMFPFRLLSQHKGTTITPTIVIPACSFFLSNPLLKDHASRSTIFPLPCSPSYFYHVPFCPRLTTKKEQPLLLACSLSERFLQKKEQPSCVCQKNALFESIFFLVVIIIYCVFRAFGWSILLLSYGMTYLRIAEYYETVSMNPVVIPLRYKSSIKSKMC